MSKILVVDFAASNGGALSVLNEYYNKALLDKSNEYVFLLNDYYFEEKDNVKIIILKKEKKWINRLIFDFISGKNIVKEINPDEILSLQNTIIHGVKVKQRVYVHQSIPFQNIKKFSFFKKGEFKLAVIQYLIGFCIKLSIKKSDRVIVQTYWMKKAIIDSCKKDEKLIDVVTPKIDSSLVRKCNSDIKNHFFYPTSNELYKNNEIIYKAVETLKKDGFNDFQFELTIEGNSTENVKFLGKISREEVFEKYSSSILVFPSYIETFGLPLLEAKECGCTIIAADTPFAHEILDNYKYVIFFNPFNIDELYSILREIIRR